MTNNWELSFSWLVPYRGCFCTQYHTYPRYYHMVNSHAKSYLIYISCLKSVILASKP